jgi:uncharacterized protein YggE
MGQGLIEGENVEVIVKRIALMVVALVACADVAAAQTPTPAETPVVVTVGQGVVKRAPDQAWVTIAAESRAKAPAEAQKLNADAMSAVMQKLKGVGLPPEAIQTSAYELRPEFDYANNRQTLRGYVARNAVEVRVDDLPKLGQVLDVSVGAGATSVSGIRFDQKVVRIEVHREAAMPPPRPMYAMRAEMAATAEPPIAPGELEVKATVTMTSAVR